MAKSNKTNKKDAKFKQSARSYEEEKDRKQKRVVQIFAWGLLIIMALTLISWSMIGSPAGHGGSEGRNIPFTQNIFQNPQTGDTYDGAVIDGIQFIFFEDVTPYVDDQRLISLSSTLKQLNGSLTFEYVDSSFENDDARFLINQALSVNNILPSPITNLTCEVPTIVYTQNSSLLNSLDSTNQCIVIEVNATETFSFANGLTYHLIKDIR